MPGFWERLEAKQARRAQVPILVGDLQAAQQAVSIAGGALAAHEAAVKAKGKQSAADKKKHAQLTKRLEETVRAAAATVEMVDVQAMDPDEHEALCSAHTGPTGDPDLKGLLPPLMAASCVDEELRDEEKWAELLARPIWTAGERDELRLRVLGLNQVAPARLGKG